MTNALLISWGCARKSLNWVQSLGQRSLFYLPHTGAVERDDLVNAMLSAVLSP